MSVRNVMRAITLAATVFAAYGANAQSTNNPYDSSNSNSNSTYNGSTQSPTYNNQGPQSYDNSNTNPNLNNSSAMPVDNSNATTASNTTSSRRYNSGRMANSKCSGNSPTNPRAACVDNEANGRMYKDQNWGSANLDHKSFSGTSGSSGS